VGIQEAAKTKHKKHKKKNGKYGKVIEKNSTFNSLQRAYHHNLY